MTDHGWQPGDIRPPEYPSSEPTWIDTTESTTTSADVVVRRGGSRFAVVGVALALVVGGAFAIRSALSSPTGPETASAAVDTFFAAVDDEDLLGMVEVWLPSERASVLEPGLELVRELERLDIVDAGTADRIDGDEAEGLGYDLSVEGLETSERLLGDGMAVVTLHAGTIRLLDGDVDGMFGAIGDEDADVDLAELDDPVELVVVQEGGGWYLSLWYQVAETIRREGDHPVPAFGNGVVPVGADTPEGAVSGMVEAGVDLDLRGVIARLDPSEARALHDYAPLFLDDVDDEVARWRDELAADGISWRLDRFETVSSDWRGHTIVSLEAFGMSIDAPDGTIVLDVDDECIRATAPGEDDIDLCWEDATAAELEEFGLTPESLGWQGGFLGAGSGITVVERDGGWFVSGVPTFMHTMIRYLEIVGDENGLLENWFVDELTWSLEDWFDDLDGREPVLVERATTTVPVDEWSTTTGPDDDRPGTTLPDGSTTVVPSETTIPPTTEPGVTTTGPEGDSTTTIDPGFGELAAPMDAAWIPNGFSVEPSHPEESWLSSDGITSLWWTEDVAAWGVIAETRSPAAAAGVVEATAIEWNMSPHPDRGDLLTDEFDVIVAHGRFVIALNESPEGIAAVDAWRATLPLD